MLDRGVGLVDPVIGQVLGHRDAVDVEDHPGARAVLEGRQPGHRVAVLAIGHEAVSADLLLRDPGAGLGAGQPFLRLQEPECRGTVARIELAGGATDHRRMTVCHDGVEHRGQGRDAIDLDHERAEL